MSFEQQSSTRVATVDVTRSRRWAAVIGTAVAISAATVPIVAVTVRVSEPEHAAGAVAPQTSPAEPPALSQLPQQPSTPDLDILAGALRPAPTDGPHGAVQTVTTQGWHLGMPEVTVQQITSRLLPDTSCRISTRSRSDLPAPIDPATIGSFDFQTVPEQTDACAPGELTLVAGVNLPTTEQQLFTRLAASDGGDGVLPASLFGYIAQINRSQIPDVHQRAAILRLLARIPGVMLQAGNDRAGRFGLHTALDTGAERYVLTVEPTTGELLAFEDDAITAPAGPDVNLPTIRSYTLFVSRSWDETRPHLPQNSPARQEARHAMTTIVTARHRATSALHALDHGLLSTLDHLLRRRAHPRQLDVMLAPHQRALGSVRPAHAYQRGQHVLAFVANAWHPATILATNDAAAYVRYQVPGSGGTGVETVHAASIAATPNEATASQAMGTAGTVAGTVFPAPTR